MTPSTDANADLAVLIGRFQPFHNGHATLLQLALASAPTVLVVLGSAHHARSAKNPFTWSERAAMIAATLPAADRERVRFTGMRDHYDDRRWAAAVSEQVAQVAAQAPQAATVALVGHFKDASSYYLNLFPDWHLMSADRTRDIDATSIRRILFESENIEVSIEVLNELVPLAVRQYLKAWTMLPDYATLREEHRRIAAYQAAWRSAPYPPVFCTVDAVVQTAGQVLLVRRGGYPGNGLWALPGGFVEPRERLLQAALRELGEETGLGVLASTLEQALVAVKVFDHPDRSERGRTITHAHFFDLQLDHLPEVEGADDAARAEWIPIEQLLSMEQAFFEDHFHILDSFLALTGP